MANEDDSERSAFTRPRFLIAAVVVILIVVAGIVVVTVNLNRHDPSPSAQPSKTASAAPSAEPSAAAGGTSVCGLKGVVKSGTVTSAPETTWKYQGVLAYPSSPVAGPAASRDSYRYCYQHSPEGALFAAANIAILSSDPTIKTTWLPYILSAGKYHDTLLAAAQNASNTAVRMDIAGFRMLSYDGSTAVVDIGFQASTGGQLVSGSFVSKLVWADGDWKIDASDPSPTAIDQLPNLAGYTAWAER